MPLGPVRKTLSHRGCSLRYALAGEGPPVLMIQGAGVGGGGWAPQVEALQDRHRCLTFDNRGFGASQPPGAPLSVAQMVDDALALMDAEAWPRAHVVGHSIGGLLALFLARRAPERVRSLSLLCTFASGAVPTRFAPWMLSLGLRTFVGTRQSKRRAFLELVVSPEDLGDADPDVLASRLGELFGRDLADRPPIILRQLAAIRHADATPFLHELAAIPTLVVSAGRDRLAPPDAGRALAAGIPGARLVLLPTSSHAATITQADRVNALLREHLDAP